jgi:hypothetical protein
MTIRSRLANGTIPAASLAGGSHMSEEQKEGLDEAAIEQETAVPLPEREALSIIGADGKLVPLTDVVLDTGQGIDERVTE